jgi:hypothetical protein
MFDPRCVVTRSPQGNAAYAAAYRRMVISIYFDRESFDALKALVGAEATNNLGRAAGEETVTHRIKREALKRVFDQIRDMEYDDGT